MTDDRSPALIIADAIANISEGHAQLAVDALRAAGWEIVRKSTDIPTTQHGDIERTP